MIPTRLRLSRLAAVLLAALAAAAAAASAGAGDDAVSGIHVTGVGEVEVIPDVAEVTLEARREGEDPAALKTELDDVVSAVLALADELGIERRHVTAAAVNIFPRYRRGDDDVEEKGIIASRTIQVDVDDLARLAELINGALARGANGVSGVQLDISNRAEVEQKALDLAIDHTMREAQQVAERFGVRLGALEDASTRTRHAEPFAMERAVANDAAAESFSPGVVTIRRTVDATFGIRDDD
ncbi:MAG: SIMPL domain-containing protein [Pseudomonadota bacterium]